MNRSKALCSAGFFLLGIAFLLTVIDSRCFDRSFYRKEYEKNNTAEYMQMSGEDLEKTTDVLLGYLKDERDDIIVTASVAGIEREVFDERETLHMIDVKALYQNALKARDLTLAAGLVCLAIAFFTGREFYPAAVKAGYKNGIGLIFALISALAVWALMDFYAFWIQFHELFFDNDLYLLDPNTELLIRMVPETFFFDLVMRIVLVFCGGVIIFGIALHFIREEKNDPRCSL